MKYSNQFTQPMNRIVSRDKIAEIVKAARAEGKTVVLANGAFDIFHVGHLRYLRGAREMGDVLVVAINDDESVRALKGKGRPVIGLEDRMAVVAAMEPVDYVVPFGETTVTPIIELIRPDVHAKGADYTEETVPERDVVASYGGRTAIVGDPKDHSSSDLITEISRKD